MGECVVSVYSSFSLHIHRSCSVPLAYSYPYSSPVQLREATYSSRVAHPLAYSCTSCTPVRVQARSAV